MDDTQIIADGAYWVDADGKDSWDLAEAEALAAMLETMGYDVTIAY